MITIKNLSNLYPYEVENPYPYNPEYKNAKFFKLVRGSKIFLAIASKKEFKKIPSVDYIRIMVFQNNLNKAYNYYLNKEELMDIKKVFFDINDYGGIMINWSNDPYARCEIYASDKLKALKEETDKKQVPNRR